MWYRTALYAAANGYKVDCACYEWPEKEKKLQALEAAGCTVYRLSNKGRAKKNLAEKLRYKLAKIQAAQQAARLPFSAYDVVVVNQGGFEVHTSAWRGFYKKFPRYALLFHNYQEGEAFSSSKAAALRAWMQGASRNLFAARRIRDVLEAQLRIAVPHAGVLINPITFVPPSPYSCSCQLRAFHLADDRAVIR